MSCAVNQASFEKYNYPKELKDKLTSNEVMKTRDVFVEAGKIYNNAAQIYFKHKTEIKKIKDKSLKKKMPQKYRTKLDSISFLIASYNKKSVNGKNNKKNKEFYSEMNEFLEKKKKKGFKSSAEYQEWKSHRKTMNRFLFNNEKFIKYYASINWSEKSDTFIQAERHKAYRQHATLRTLITILYYELVLLLAVTIATG